MTRYDNLDFSDN